jgi:hypothetical protein
VNIQEIYTKITKQSRLSGTSFNTEICEYIYSELERMGYIVKKQSHPFVGWELLEKPVINFETPIKHTPECIGIMGSGSTCGKILKGKLLPFFGAMATFEAYEFQKYFIADDSGTPIAIIMTRPDMVWSQSIDSRIDQLPHIMVDRQTCAYINQWIADNKDIVLSFSVNTETFKNKTITNIIAEKKEGGSGLFLSTHFDSFYNTVGAHDNASGVVSLLEISERLSNQDINPTICFFDAEEWNKYGSYCYVKQLIKDNALKNVHLQINLDSVGVPDFLYMLTTPSIEKNIERMVKTIPDMDSLKVDISSKAKIPQFDVWPFMKNGVDTIQVGSRSDPPFKAWHSPEDNMANIDFEFVNQVNDYMEKFIVLANTEFVKKGD